MVFSRQKRWRLVCNTLKSEIPQYNNLLIFSPLSLLINRPLFVISHYFTHHHHIVLLGIPVFVFLSLSLFPSSSLIFFDTRRKKDTAYTRTIDAYDFYRRHDQATHNFLLKVYYIASPPLSCYLAVLRMTSQLSPLIYTWTTYIKHQQKKERENARPLLFFSYPLTRRNLFSENVQRFDSSLNMIITDEPRILSNEKKESVVCEAKKEEYD